MPEARPAPLRLPLASVRRRPWALMRRLNAYPLARGVLFGHALNACRLLRSPVSHGCYLASLARLGSTI